MKRSIRILSVFLCAVLLLGIAAPVTAFSKVRTSDPVIYVRGQGTPLYNKDGEQIYPLDVEDGYLSKAVKDCMPSFLDAVRNDTWEVYCEDLYNAVYPIFEEIALNEDGEVTDGSGVEWTWSRSTLKNTKKNGTYGMQDYMFYYDWRLDPFTVAADLSRYINDVLYVTGASKVNIIGRCEGACVVQAYLKQYGVSKIDNYCLYSQAVSGVNTVSGTFSGKIQLDASSIDRYADYYLDLDNALLDELLGATLDLAVATNGLNLATGYINQIYAKAYNIVLPRLILATYGTMPGIWAMVSTDDYEEAMELNFSGKEAQYSKLIAKIENYHNKISVPFEKDLRNYRRNGVDLMVISKYGFQAAPLFQNNEELSDGAATVTRTTMGATTSLVGKTLDASYIEAQEAAGYGHYISADKQVDMSTCLLPNYTWIVKGLEHKVFPVCVEELISAFFITDGDMNINTYDVFPQFLVYDANTNSMEPMTEENSGYQSWEDNSIFSALIRFFRSIIAMFARLFGIEGLI